ncbi:MAG TPA: hypothetical protein VN151_04340 [Terracidiphilus sp.]|nr:hypothetical protein [Terracidiphilus sp.]
MKSLFFQEVEIDPSATARRLMQRVHNRDGLPEICIGVILLASAFLIWLQVAYPRGSFAYGASSWGMILLIAPMIGVSQPFIKWLRRRFLIERVGYVELRPVPRKLLIIATCVAVTVAAAMAYGVYRRAIPSGSWMIAGTGMAWGFLAAYAGRLPRYVIGGGLMAVLGICLGFCKLSFELGSLILYASMGILSLLSGCVVLLHFLRKQDEEAD